MMPDTNKRHAGCGGRCACCEWGEAEREPSGPRGWRLAGFCLLVFLVPWLIALVAGGFFAARSGAQNVAVATALLFSLAGLPVMFRLFFNSQGDNT